MFSLPYDLVPVKFHPYTSRTMNRVFEIRMDNSNSNEINKLRQEFLIKFNQFGIQAKDDNKIVFECALGGDNFKKIYYGFYDGNFSIGLSCYDENER